MTPIPTRQCDLRSARTAVGHAILIPAVRPAWQVTLEAILQRGWRLASPQHLCAVVTAWLRAQSGGGGGHVAARVSAAELARLAKFVGEVQPEDSLFLLAYCLQVQCAARHPRPPKQLPRPSRAAACGGCPLRHPACAHAHRPSGCRLCPAPP